MSDYFTVFTNVYMIRGLVYENMVIGGPKNIRNIITKVNTWWEMTKTHTYKSTGCSYLPEIGPIWSYDHE
jgi:hypothetical protein